MKTFQILLFLGLIAVTGAALADGTRYLIQVDGLACPLCAYNIEKQLKGTAGVIPDSIRVDLAAGRVQVDVRPDVTLSDDMLEELFRDAGFTYRGKEIKPHEPEGA